jgi:hypothetical protein
MNAWVFCIWGLYTFTMLSFVEWAFVVEVRLHLPSIPLMEALRRGGGRAGYDEGEQEFIDSTNQMMRSMIGQLLKMNKFADPRNAAEAKAIVDDHTGTYFPYAQALMKAARGGAAEMTGADILQAAEEANGQIWMDTLNPKLFEQPDVTWETLNPGSAEQKGIRGTLRKRAYNATANYARAMQKRRAGRRTVQMSQLEKPEKKGLDPAASGDESWENMEWDDLRRAVLANIQDELDELRMRGGSGTNYQKEVARYQWALEIVRRQMAIPMTWIPTAEILAQIPELADIPTGEGRRQFIKIIERAKRKALGEEQQESVRLALEEFRQWLSIYEHDTQARRHTLQHSWQ